MEPVLNETTEQHVLSLKRCVQFLEQLSLQKNGRASAMPAIHVTPSRYVTIELAAAITGFTEAAIRAKINKGVWLEGRQWIKREGRVLIDMKGYELWVEAGTA